MNDKMTAYRMSVNRKVTANIAPCFPGLTEDCVSNHVNAATDILFAALLLDSGFSASGALPRSIRITYHANVS